MAHHRPIIANPVNGNQTAVDDFIEFDYIVSVNRPTVALLTVKPQMNPALLGTDCRIYPEMTLGGGWAQDARACFFVRKSVQTRSGTKVLAYHANEMLARRIIAYSSVSTYAVKASDAAGDQIRAFARENIGASFSATDRDGSTDTGTDLVTAGYLTIGADLGDGSLVVKQADRRSMLQVMQEVANNSASAGTYLAFGVVTGRESGIMNLITRTGQWGEDRRPFELFEGGGGLDGLIITDDATREVNVAIGAGRGVGDDRIISVAYNTARIIASPLNRREAYVDVPAGTSAGNVGAMASARLRDRRAMVTAEAELTEDPRHLYGVNYFLGDIVVIKAAFGGRVTKYDMRLDTVMVMARPNKSVVRGVFRSL